MVAKCSPDISDDICEYDGRNVSKSIAFSNKFVIPYCWAETYAGSIACCPLLSHSEYADGTDGQTDRRQTVTLSFPLDAASIMSHTCSLIINSL